MAAIKFQEPVTEALRTLEFAIGMGDVADGCRCGSREHRGKLQEIRKRRRSYHYLCIESHLSQPSSPKP